MWPELSPGDRIIRVSSTRLALFFAALVTVLTSVLLVTVYLLTRSALDREIAAVVRTEVEDLSADLRLGGVERVAATLRMRTDSWGRTGAVFLLADRDFRPVAGNLSEWCQFVYGGEVLRGGSWSDNQGEARSALRYGRSAPFDRSNYLGFRVRCSSHQRTLSGEGAARQRRPPIFAVWRRRPQLPTSRTSLCRQERYVSHPKGRPKIWISIGCRVKGIARQGPLFVPPPISWMTTVPLPLVITAPGGVALVPLLL